MTTENDIQPSMIHMINTYTTNQFIDKLHETFDPSPKALQIFFNIDYLKQSVIGVCFIKPLLYLFESGKQKKFVTAKDLNEKFNNEILFLNFRKGIEHKLKPLKHQYYSLDITIDKHKHEE
jgi:adenosine deaminase